MVSSLNFLLKTLYGIDFTVIKKTGRGVILGLTRDGVFLASAVSDYYRFQHRKDVYILQLALIMDKEPGTPPDFELEHMEH
jgi:hypothetical protein